jgi:uncharacterized protein (TIGR02217 family)
MNNFQNIVLPDFLSQYIVGGPRFDTSIIQSISGREARYSNLQYASQKYLIKDCSLSAFELEEFNCFFRNCKGAAFSFCLKDYSDYQVRQQVLQSPVPGQLSFELFKYYKFDEKIYLRRILKPIEGSVKVLLDNQEIQIEIDYNYGLINIQEALHEGQILLVDFDFYVPVRFANDHFNYCIAKDGSLHLEDVQLTEVML